MSPDAKLAGDKSVPQSLQGSSPHRADTSSPKPINDAARTPHSIRDRLALLPLVGTWSLLGRVLSTAAIITNLLDLEAISWKQTEETSLVLKHRNQKKRAPGGPLFQSCFKGWDSPPGEERSVLFSCNVYTAEGLTTLFSYWFGLHVSLPWNNRCWKALFSVHLNLACHACRD